MRVRLVGLGLLLLLMFTASCTRVHPRSPAGTGTYSYVSGWLTWTYPTDIDTAWPATLRAMQALDLKIQRQALDGLGGRIKALRADRTTVSVRLKPAGDRVTRISVRVGTLGNRERAMNIHEAIRAELKL